MSIKIETTIPSITFGDDEFNFDETPIPVVYATEKSHTVIKIAPSSEEIVLTRETLDNMIDILDSVSSLNDKLGG